MERNSTIKVTLGEASCVEAMVGGETKAFIGRLLSMSESTIVIAHYSDFVFAGITWLNRYETGASVVERDSIVTFFEEVIRKVGQSELSVPSHFVHSLTIADALSCAMKVKKLVIVEGRNAGEFEVGKVTAVSENQVGFSILSSDGNWSGSSTPIKIRNVAALTVFSTYCNMIENFFSAASRESSEL